MDKKDVLKKAQEQFKTILEQSNQSIYIYLDDSHKHCNERFSNLLGYNSPDEWASVGQSFTEAFVAQKSQHSLVAAYQAAMQLKIGSQIEITWLKQSGESVD